MSEAPTSSEPPDRLERLAAARDRLSTAIDTCESMRDLPSLIREYRAVLEEIHTLSPTAKAGDPVDEVAKRRADRGAGAAAGAVRPKSKRG